MITLSDLNRFSGTYAYYHCGQGLLITDGVRCLMNTCRGYWLTNFIEKCQWELVKDSEMKGSQLWELEKIDDLTGIVRCRQDDSVILTKTFLTDFFAYFNDKKVCLLLTLEDLVLMLPSEY